MQYKLSLLAVAVGSLFSQAQAASVTVGQDGATFNNGQHQLTISAPVYAPKTMQATPAHQAGQFSEFSSNNGAKYDTVKNVSTAGRFNDLVRFIADQLTQNRDVKNLSDTHFAVASIVGLDDISRTNKLGYLIQEHLVHELQVRGFKVVDFKLMSDQIQVTQNGDFVFSRDPKRLKKQYDIADVVSGTYSFQADGVVLNIRAVDTRTGVVTTSAQAYLPRTDYEHIMTGRQGVYHNGEYFYREQSDVRIVERPVPYEGTHNTVKIVK